MEIHIVAPAIPLSIGPFINLTVRMIVKVGDASGRKHDDITWPERHNQTRLIQAQLAVFKVPYGDDYAEPLILAVPVPQCRGIEINDH